MAAEKTVIMIGLDPSVVDYSKYPGLTAEKLRGAMASETTHFAQAGMAATVCFVDTGATAVATVTAALKAQPYDFVLIGAGVRTDPGHLALFEKLVNVAHRHAPSARICFNTNPTDNLAAVQRWM